MTTRTRIAILERSRRHSRRADDFAEERHARQLIGVLLSDPEGAVRAGRCAERIDAAEGDQQARADVDAECAALMAYAEGIRQRRGDADAEETPRVLRGERGQGWNLVARIVLD